MKTKRPATWPLILLAVPAFVAIWAGWVELGRMTGFGVVHPLPGIAPEVSIDTAVTLPIGVEAYAALALRTWLGGQAVTVSARRFAKWSAIASLVLGAAGQVAYHLMHAAGVDTAPWPVTATVATLPVAVLGMGAALIHLLAHQPDAVTEAQEGADTASQSAVSVATTMATAPAPEVDMAWTRLNAVPAVAAMSETMTMVPATSPATTQPVTEPTEAAPAAVNPEVDTEADTAAKVAAIVAANPDITNAELAKAINKSDRTARRYRAALDSTAA